MSTIYELKEEAVTDTPLLLFDCALTNGQRERWSTHGVVVGGVTYEARVLSHNVFEMQSASDQGVDGMPRISILLANADSHFSEVERATGWKGARLTVSFLFYDLRGQAPASDIAVLFQGICNPPDEIREATFQITAGNRMNLQRTLLPEVRIQRRCPWDFPATADQRLEAVAGGSSGKYSQFYRCGYSAGAAGGTGTLNGNAPFTECGFTREDCEARGMFLRFGGFAYVPPAILVRTSGDKNWHTSAVTDNTARYNDFVPMVYGTAWFAPPVVFTRNDGNLTRMQVLLGIGEMTGVITVLVNNVEIPQGVSGQNMTGTGWYNIVSLGTRDGAFDLDFTDASGQPAGDPYGSMAYLSVVVPNRLNDGTTLPSIKVLAQGLKVPIYGNDGTLTGEQFSNNPAWVLLDILQRTGWTTAEIDIPSFAAAAAYCDEAIAALDIYGNPIQLARFQCNFPLKNRKSAGDLARGVRSAGRLLLTYSSAGLMQLRVENTIAAEQPAKPAWSNSAQPLNGGWPNYEFGDGSDGFGGILRKANGEPSVRLYSRSVADTPNRFSVEFQDSLNGYQQDSYSIVDPDDVALCGQEVAATVAAIGIPHYDQAGRILMLNLDKSIRGNTYIEFETSVKALGVRPGDLITVTYLKEGFSRQPFRVLKIAPGVNHRLTTIAAQIHDDAWYADSNGQPDSATGGGWQGEAGIGVPLPLVGAVVDANGATQFGVQEATGSGSGDADTNVTVSWVPSSSGAVAGPGSPLVNLIPTVEAGGTLTGNQVLYYAATGRDSAGNEGAPSFLVRAVIGSDGSKVTLSGLSFAPGTAAFHVYRGATPAQLFRIASDQAPASQFTDAGLANQSIGPPDPNFDHANFYWRMERLPESAATSYSANTVGNGSLQMVENAYLGMIARITRGRGAGQERAISSNTATDVTVSPAWAATPDGTSSFAVADSGWQFGAQTRSATAQFTVPNRPGETAQITGRAANANDVECAPELSIVTRWKIGGSGAVDAAVPPQPFFALGAGRQGGTVELSGVSFGDLMNTRSISSATLRIYYWDELQGAPTIALAAAVGVADTTITLSQAGPGQPGTFIQIEGEVLRVEASLHNGTSYTVTRGMHGSVAATHLAQTPIYHLACLAAIAPFPPDFFGSSYSGTWSYPVVLPNARVASAELFATNGRGNSPTSSACLTHVVESGLRTLSGGQYTIQVEGFLAVDQSAALALVVEAGHAVRDVYAVLGTVADAQVKVTLNVNGNPYCTLTFEAGRPVSDSALGYQLPPLALGSTITLAVGPVGQTSPGADLTVLIRL
ncbi:MAG: phage tail protein [Bryobacteraceae bacterium]|jgi:hypothetical protein